MSHKKKTVNKIYNFMNNVFQKKKILLTSLNDFLDYKFNI